MKQGTLALWLLVNAVALFMVFNPWFESWVSQGVTLLVVEALFLVVIGLPLFIHHFFRKKKPFGQSLSDSVRSVLDFLCGWV